MLASILDKTLKPQLNIIVKNQYYNNRLLLLFTFVLYWSRKQIKINKRPQKQSKSFNLKSNIKEVRCRTS